MGPMGAQSAGRGFRRGRRSLWGNPIPPLPPEEERSRLEQRKDWLQRQIDTLARQLEDMP